MRTSTSLFRALVAAATLATLVPSAHADRIKDLASVGGVRDNHLTGFGLVIGLDSSGDDIRSPMVRDSLAKMLKKLGITVNGNDIRARNVAAVMITAELPPFAKPGHTLDIHVSSIGNAKSLSGGVLLAAPLKGPDQRTWAIAQGSLSVGGFTAEGFSGSSQKKNSTLVGTVPGGAIVEHAAPTVLPTKQIAFNLKTPDFTTATRMRDSIVAALGADTARIGDASTVIVPIPKDQKDVVALIAKIEALEVDPDVKAKVIVDERTGTVVIGESVTLRPAAITFGALTIEIEESPEVSQPNAPFGRTGQTQVVPRTAVKVKEQDNPIRVVGKAATVGDVAAALGSLGAKPRDLVAILRALKAAGALRAELETM